jgi:hypothetical protein
MFAPKFGTRSIRLTPPVRPVSLNGLTGGASCSRSGNGHTGLAGGQCCPCTEATGAVAQGLQIGGAPKFLFFLKYMY